MKTALKVWLPFTAALALGRETDMIPVAESNVPTK